MKTYQLLMGTTLCLMLIAASLHAAPSRSLRTDAMATNFQKMIADSTQARRRTRRSTSVSSRTIRYLRLCVSLLRDVKAGRINGHLLPHECKRIYCNQFRIMQRPAPSFCHQESVFIGGM